MNRKEKILSSIDKEGLGLEIGPSHNPVAAKKESYKVEIIDHLNQDQLLEKYKDHNLNLDNIEPVDYVWKGGSYQDITGKSKYYDWIIASHVIEHTPDLIRFLQDCDSILKDNGVLSLAIPDARYCFDILREISSIGRVIDAFELQNTVHTPGTVAEYFINVVEKNGLNAWNKKHRGQYHYIHSFNDAQKGMQIARNKGYLDVHAWCFTPSSFRLLMNDLFQLGFISFKELSFFPTVGHEFFVTLSRKGLGIPVSRMELAGQVKSELKEIDL